MSRSIVRTSETEVERYSQKSSQVVMFGMADDEMRDRNRKVQIKGSRTNAQNRRSHPEARRRKEENTKEQRAIGSRAPCGWPLPTLARKDNLRRVEGLAAEFKW